jgi:hypothetical protein
LAAGTAVVYSTDVLCFVQVSVVIYGGIMKKIIFLVGMLVMASTLFAQKFSLDGHLATNFESVSPTLGFEVNLSKIDVLAGIGFGFYKNGASYSNYSISNEDHTNNEDWINIFAGIAPKVFLNDKLTLSFPLLAKIHFGNASLEYDSADRYITGSLKQARYFGYGFDTGARLYFTFTERWSIYTGAIAQVLYIFDNKYAYWKGSATSTYTRENNGMTWFIDGNVELGVRFTF